MPFSPQERDEASRLTSTSSGHRFEIQLGHLCNNRCVFCSSGHLTQLGLARRIKVDPIIEALSEARAQGARHLTFLGGEPTVHKGFLQALRHSVELGFEEIVIFTNGVMFSVPGFIDSVVALGQFEWRISIQGGNEAAHVAVTKRPNSFARILHGLERLQSLGQTVTANLCVNEHSYESLPDYPALVERWGIVQLHVDIIRPVSTERETDSEYLRSIMPRYSTMAPFLASMLGEFQQRAPDFDVNIGNLPYCVLPEYGHQIHHGGTETVTHAATDQGLEAPIDKYGWHRSLRRHPDSCERCVYRPDCTGVFSEYLELYGSDEFKPVSREQLAKLDPRRRQFLLHAFDWLTTLEQRAEEAPWGFTCRVHRDSHSQEFEFRYERATLSGAQQISLLFQAPGQGGLLESPDFSVDVNVVGAVAPTDLVQLVGWNLDILQRPGEPLLRQRLNGRLLKQRLLTAHREAARARVLSGASESDGKRAVSSGVDVLSAH